MQQNEADEDLQQLPVSFPKFVNLTKEIEPAPDTNYSLKERTKLHALPRSAFNTPELSRPKSPWSLAKSVFANYKFDTDELMATCFDYDWGCSTLDRSIKDPI